MTDEEGVPVIHPDADGPQGCSNKACNPLSTVHRYLMLFFICFLSFGSYYCYDNPAALQSVFNNKLNMSQTTYMNLYSFYSWPNVVLSFFGGILIDRVIGVRWGAVMFSAIIMVGQVLFAAGGFAKSIELMYFARLVFGIGGECLAVAQNCYVTVWFKPHEMNFVFGLTLSMARIGSTVNMNTMLPIYNAIGATFGLTGWTEVGAALLVASVFCVYSFVCAFILGIFYARFVKAHGDIYIREGYIPKDDVVEEIEKDPISISTTEKKTESIKELSELEGSQNEYTLASVNENPDDAKISFKTIIHFPASIWLICAICVLYYVAVFPFVSLAPVFFETHYHMTTETAAAVASIIYIASAVGSPVFGFLVDMTGANLTWVITGVSITTVCHILFAFTVPLTPYVTMVIFGLSYSILASSLWPMVGIILPPQQRATAYGLIQSIQNLGLGVVGIVAGAIVDAKGYIVLEWVFIAWLALAFVSALLLILWDARHGRKLNEFRCFNRCGKGPKPEDEQEVLDVDEEGGEDN